MAFPGFCVEFVQRPTQGGFMAVEVSRGFFLAVGLLFGHPSPPIEQMIFMDDPTPSEQICYQSSTH